ncbi:hypothetical protein Clacol_002570 [Clathrus columnatus]|uniref:Protein kinase domain-containing protein n=1 Tax=Clathrus columnatus TaxID=1419009 RepID=A0AAV5A130_9AGAM|nr:hypothetical protein Clacol_002570 [Clathrus columnatus]
MAHRVVETHTIRKSQDSRSNPYINQYELISILGEGMHGKVMLARDTASPTKDKVAIKVMRRVDPHNRRLPRSSKPDVLPPTAQQETESKIRREIAVMKKCTHQNLVRLLEVIDDPASKKVYLVMENLAGGEVKWRSRDHSEPVLELSQIQRIMRDVTLGLEYLHHQGIIHRDIKPANLLWTEDRQSVKICDFGVSHFAAPSDLNDVGLSKTAGSPAFFAPELCKIPDISFDNLYSPQSSRDPVPSTSSLLHIPPITKQIDIWALGVTLYCLLFGKPPWQGHTEYQMFRAICSDDFEIPDTMARDRILTGGRTRRHEGKELGWCIVSLLEGLLEKDQEKRVSLADVKKIPWVQYGVREPERWLRETAPNKHNRVVITDEDAQSAIKQAKFSYYPLFLARVVKVANKIKRVPLHLSRSSTTKANDALMQTSPDPLSILARAQEKSALGWRNPATFSNSQPPSLSKANGQRTRDAVERKTKRFTISSSSPLPKTAASSNRRRNSTAGLSEDHNPPNGEAQRPLHTSSTPRVWGKRRQSDSLHAPSSSTRHLSFFKGNSSTSVSAPISTSTPNELQQPTTKGNLKQKLSRVMRSSSMKRKFTLDGSLGSSLTKRISLDGERQASRKKRTSAETLNVLRSTETESLGLTHTMRASSWGSPGDPDEHVDDDTGLSFDLSVSGASGSGMGVVGIQDFNKSVVRIGAGGYIDSPSSGNSNEYLSDNSQSISPNSDSSISSESTTRQPQLEPYHHPPRVTSPLARPYATASEDEGYSSEVFEDTGPEDGNSSDEDVIQLKTRRPSTVLHRSTNASPLR